MISLSDNQRQAVECLTNCLAVACPGSGKTRVLAQKVVHILKVDPGANILITSFTKDSASDIRKRIIDLVGEDAARKVASGTFHSIALDQLKKAGFKGTILGPGQIEEYVERALKESKLVNIELDQAKELIETCKLDVDYKPSNDDLGRLFSNYSRLLNQINAIDFTDMLRKAVNMMRSKDLAPKNCKYLLIDESQDMDEMQYQWCVEHIKAGAIFTVVGDDDQSIYKFRRALGYEGMMRFAKEFGAKLIMLDTNYRCHAEILDAAGKLISTNANRVYKKLEAVRGSGGTVTALQCNESGQETGVIIQKIKDYCASNMNPYPDDYLIGVQDGEWAVLARNNHNLRELSMAMVAHGIPYTGSEKNLWCERPVCFAIGLLTALMTGEKAGFDAALYFAGMNEDVLTRMHEEFGDDFSELFNEYRQVDFGKYGHGTAICLNEFTIKVQQWRRSLSRERPSMAVYGVFDWFIGQMNSYTYDQKEKRKIQRDLEQLSAARQILGEMKGSLQHRLERVSNKKDNENAHKPSGVFLGTLHSSKGLEFKNVWLLQIDDGVIPDIKQDTADTLEEERRLFYVGMTRAKDQLFISCSKKPSKFIAEAGIELKGTNESDNTLYELS